VLCLRLEGASVRICDQLTGSSPGQAHWASHLEEAARWLKVMIAERHQVDVELEVLRAFATLVRDLVLGGAGRSSSLAASLAMVVEEVEKQINAVAAIGV
jgi:hypothetical protein